MRATLIDPADGVGADLSVSFVAPAAIDDGLAARLGLRRSLAAVKPTREVGKAQMINNDALPDIRVDPETFAIHVDGELIEPDPATHLPLTQLYAMF
jgi:urease subunit alpha